MAGLLGVDGIISGFSTSDIVAKLMAIERLPVQALQTRKVTREDRSKAVQAINTKLAALASIVSRLSLRSTINAKIAATDTPTTSPAVLTASASADAANGSFKVTASQLASATKVSSTEAIGQAVDQAVALASAGFSLTPTTGTFSINGVAITIDASTVLSNGVDNPSDNTIIAKINNAGVGVTASIVNDADGRSNRLQLVSSAGTAIRLGSGADTSNFLSAAKLLSAQVTGNSAATVTGTAVAAGTIAATAITINGVTTTTTATDPGNTAAQNAASIASDINNTAGTTVTATGNGDGTITLTHNSLGSSYTIDVTAPGTGTGLSLGTAQNGTDVAVSTGGMGGVLTGEPLSSARLVTALSGLDPDGSGSFEINGVTISFKETESLNAVISRINAASAGVVASYDSVLDRLQLTATQTGGSLISLEDVTGNFLVATDVLAATQTQGQNALYSIDTVNGGQQLSSSSNTITGVVPGVTLELKGTSASAVTVTVSQDTAATVKDVKSFVDQYNAMTDLIRTYTAYDASTKQAGILLGDSTVKAIQNTLQTLVMGTGVGLSSSLRSLSDVGLTTGAVGSALGATKLLVLDETKFTTALRNNPDGMTALFAGFSSSAALDAGGTGSIASISGAPTKHHEAGTYAITSDASGNLSVVFTPSGGTARAPVTGTITAGGNNGSLILGITLTAKGTLAAGTDTITVTVSSRGVMPKLKDYVDGLTSSTGVLTTRKTESDNSINEIAAQISRMEVRLAEKEERLMRQFNALEVALARLQSQSAQVSAQLSQFNKTTSE